jgi:hypothetical protein
MNKLFIFLVIVIILELSCISSATWTGNMSVNLLSYWKLDNNNLNDSLNANNGTIGGTNVSGKILSAQNLTTWQNITLGSNTIDLSDGNLTINAWIIPYTISGASDRGILGSITNNGYYFYYKGINGNLTFGKVGINEVISKKSITLNIWQMVTITYDKDANLVRYYKDGVGETGGARAYSTTFTTGLVYYLGRTTNNLTIDEVGVWTRVLSQTEITLLYNSGNGCSYGNETCYLSPNCWGVNEVIKLIYVPVGCNYYIPSGTIGYTG